MNSDMLWAVLKKSFYFLIRLVFLFWNTFHVNLNRSIFWWRPSFYYWSFIFERVTIRKPNVWSISMAMNKMKGIIFNQLISESLMENQFMIILLSIFANYLSVLLSLFSFGTSADTICWYIGTWDMSYETRTKSTHICNTIYTYNKLNWNQTRITYLPSVPYYHLCSYSSKVLSVVRTLILDDHCEAFWNAS